MCRRRQYDAAGSLQRESLAETAALLREHGVDGAALAAQLHIELVLTAHPTEATRRSVLDHQADVAALLDRLDDPRAGRSARRALRDELREVLTVWWQTEEVRRVRPRVEDEVRRNLFFFESTLFDAVPALHAELERCLGCRLDRPVLSFGSWAGGDMDGNPDVGAETVSSTLILHRQIALQLLRERVRGLARRFSHAAARLPVPAELLASIAADERELPSAEVLQRPHRRYEPLRTKLGFVEHRLANTAIRQGHEPGYGSPEELRADLELVLSGLGSAHVAEGSLRRLLWQVDVFGFHLASLDVRQASG